MTAENQSNTHTQAIDSVAFSELLFNSILHGQHLSEAGIEPSRISVAVHAHLLNHFPDSSIIRRMHSPFDVLVSHDELLFSVFLDEECHQLVRAAVEYLASDNQEHLIMG
jgi:hypothetical protein